MMSVPIILLYLIIVAAIGANAVNVVIAIAIVGTPGIARLVRGLTLDIRTRDYIRAAETRGESSWYIMFRDSAQRQRPHHHRRHARVGYAIFAMGTLGFLGMGMPPPSPDWGSMVAKGREFILHREPLGRPVAGFGHRLPGGGAEPLGRRPARGEHALPVGDPVPDRARVGGNCSNMCAGPCGATKRRFYIMNERSNKDGVTPVLDVSDLAISYKVRGGEVAAVRGVSLKVYPGETLGVVGESGCGKSTIAFGIVGYLGSNGYIKEGSVKFEGQELVGKSQAELNKLRGDRISMVYQDPMQALNPSLCIGEQLAEVLTCHHDDIAKDEAWERSIAMLKRVYMPDPGNMMTRYPHQLSGGQQQRAVIAMAMLNNPSLLIMDEPTTALDVTVEAAVLDLVADLKKDFNTGIIFITHNLGVVARVSDKICVMYAGEMVERGLISEVFKQPTHPYTRGLMRCVPRLGESKEGSQLFPIRGPGASAQGAAQPGLHLRAPLRLSRRRLP
jgi:ABC-type dipeptide/oligopeptide/nickel transport system ATPase component